MRGFFIAPQKNKFYRCLCSVIVCVLSFSLTFGPTASYAQSINLLNLPVPGAMVPLSPAFAPVLLKGMTIHPDDPLKFDFIIDSGNTYFTVDEIKKESERLVKYFLASMTVPKDELWVNLSPYEEERIIPDELGKTELGRDMLAQDYILKQLTASLMYPEKELGKKFWDKIYERAEKEFGTSEIPVNTFNKVWILPQSATVYEHEQTVYVVDARLKVMLDSDYLAMDFQQKSTAKSRAPARDLAMDSYQESTARSQSPDWDVAMERDDLSVSSQIIKEIIIPEIEREVNEGENFAPLRQIYHSLILAKWYKETIKNSLLSQVYVDQNKIAGVDVDDKTIKDQIYAQYMEAYKKGVFNYIKEDYDRLSNEIIPRKYFSGGIKGDINIKRTFNPIADSENPNYRATVKVTPQKDDASSPIAFPGSTQWYINRLDHGDKEVRIDAAQKLGEKNDIRAVKPLLKKKKTTTHIYGIPSIYVENALERLKESGTIAALSVDLLIKWLSDEHENVREFAAEKLGELRDPQAIQPLIELLSKEDHYRVRKTVVGALGQLGGEKVVDVLVKTMSGTDRASDAAAFILADLGDERAISSLIEYESRRERSNFLSEEDIENAYKNNFNVERLSKFGDSAIEVLIEKLSDSEWSIRAAAIRILEKIGDERAINPLTMRVSDEHYKNRRLAMEALETLRYKQAIVKVTPQKDDASSPVDLWSKSKYEKMLKNPNELKRVKAIKRIEKKNKSGFKPQLLEKLGDIDKGVRDEARRVLRARGTSDLVMVRFGYNKALSSINRGAVEEAISELRRIKNPAAIGPLKVVVKHLNRKLSKEAVEAIIHIGGKEATKIRQVKDRLFEEVSLLEGLKKPADFYVYLGLPDAIILRDEGYGFKVDFIKEKRYLREVDGEKEVIIPEEFKIIRGEKLDQSSSPIDFWSEEKYKEMLNHSDPLTRVEAIRRIGKKNKIRFISELLKKLSDSDKRVRDEARKVLHAHRTPSLEMVLFGYNKALLSKNDEVVAEAISELRNLKDSAVIGPLEEVRKHSNIKLRQMAAEAIIDIKKGTDPNFSTDDESSSPIDLWSDKKYKKMLNSDKWSNREKAIKRIRKKNKSGFKSQLFKMLGDTTKRVRDEAKGFFKDRRTPFKDMVRFGYNKALSSIDRGAVKEAIKGLRDIKDSKSISIELLRELRKSIGSLKEVIKHPNRELREEAVEAIIHIGGKEAKIIRQIRGRLFKEVGLLEGLKKPVDFYVYLGLPEAIKLRDEGYDFEVDFIKEKRYPREVGGEKEVIISEEFKIIRGKKLGQSSSPVGLPGPLTLNGARTVLDNSGKYKNNKVIKAIRMVGDSSKKNEEDIQRLINMLAFKDDVGLWKTAEAYLTDEQKVEGYSVALYFSRSREEAIKVLNALGDMVAVKLLAEGLSSENKDDRKNAAIELGILGDARAIDLLSEKLVDEEKKVRQAVEEALRELGVTQEQLVDRYISALSSDSGWIRNRAARILGELGDPRAVEPLVKRLPDPDHIVRQYVSEALGKIGDPQAIEPLRERESIEPVVPVKKAIEASLEMLEENYSGQSSSPIEEDSDHAKSSEIDQYLRDVKNPYWTDSKRRLQNLRREFDILDPDLEDQLLNPESVFGKWRDVELEAGNEIVPGQIYHVRVANNTILGPAKGGIRWLDASDLMEDVHFCDALKRLNKLNPAQYHVEQFIQEWIDQEAKALALWMTFKTAGLGLPLGGGKGAVFIGKIEKDDEGDWAIENYQEWRDFSNYNKAVIARQHSGDLARARKVGVNIDIPAPDMKTGDGIIPIYLDEYLRYMVEEDPENEIEIEDNTLYEILNTALKRWKEAGSDPTKTPLVEAAANYWLKSNNDGSPKSVKWLGTYTGKPADLGGVVGRTEATGYGVVDIIAEVFGSGLAGKTVSVQGFGKVGAYTALDLARRGAIVKVISDHRVTLTKKNGWSYDELKDLIDTFNQDKSYNWQLNIAWNNGIVDKNGVTAVEYDEESENYSALSIAVLEADVDILVPAAKESVISGNNAHDIKAKYIFEGANGPLTNTADEIAFKQKIFVYPDTLVSSGGVRVSSLETDQVVDGKGLTEDEVADHRKDSLIKAYRAMQRIYDMHAVEKDHTLRQTYDISSINVLAKTKYRKMIVEGGGILHDIAVSTSKTANTLIRRREVKRRIKALNLDGVLARARKKSLDILSASVNSAFHSAFFEHFEEKDIEDSLSALHEWFESSFYSDPSDTLTKIRTFAFTVEGKTKKQQAEMLDYSLNAVKKQRKQLADIFSTIDIGLPDNVRRKLIETLLKDGKNVNSADPDQSSSPVNGRTELMQKYKWRMEHWSKAVRVVAVRELGEEDSPAAVDLLIKQLEDPDRDVQLEVINVLGELRNKKAVVPLIEVAKDKPRPWYSEYVEDIREAAVESLGKIKDPIAIEPLIEMLPYVEWPLQKVTERVVKDLGATDEQFVDGNIQTLSSDHWRPQSFAAGNLGELGDPRAIEPLKKLLVDTKDNYVRKTVEEALAKLLDPGDQSDQSSSPIVFGAGTPWHIRRLRHLNSNVRMESAQKLGKRGDPRAIKPLLKVLSDRSLGVRQAAVKALDQLGATTDQLFDGYTNALFSARYDVDMKELVSVRYDVEKEAIEALAKLGDTRAFEPLIERLSAQEGFVREFVIKALGELGDTRAFEPLVEQLSSRETYVRQAAAEALGKLMDERAIEPLIKRLSDEGRRVREAVLEALVKLGATEDQLFAGFVKALTLYDSPSDPDRSGVRKFAASKLDRLGTPTAIAPSPGPWHNLSGVRKFGAEKLGRSGDPRAIDHLIRALSDTNVGVREVATEALEKLWEIASNPSRSFVWDGSEAEIDRLVNMFLAEDRRLRNTAGKVLGTLNDEKMMELLRRLGQYPEKFGIVGKALDKSGDTSLEVLKDLGMDIPGILQEDWYKEGHPSTLYHDLAHSRDVAAVFYIFAKKQGLEEDQAVFLYLVGLLHDYDPNRRPSMPPSVASTLRHLTNDFHEVVSLSGKKGKSILRNYFGWTEREYLMAMAIIQRSQFPFEEKYVNSDYQEYAPVAQYEQLLKRLNQIDPDAVRFVIEQAALFSEYADKSTMFLIGGFSHGFNRIEALVGEMREANYKNAPALKEFFINNHELFISSLGNEENFSYDRKIAAKFGFNDITFLDLDQALEKMPALFASRFKANSHAFKILNEYYEPARDNFSEAVIIALTDFLSAVEAGNDERGEFPDSSDRSSSPIQNLPGTMEWYVKRLDRDSKVTRRYAAKELGNLKDKSAIEPLKKRLSLEKDPDAHKNIKNALRKLRRLPDPSSGQSSSPIAFPGSKQWHLNRMSHKNPKVRANAAYALSVLGDSEAFEPLVKALEDQDIDVQISAIRALSRLGDFRALGSLSGELLLDGNERVRFAAAEALGMLGDPGAVEYLEIAVKDSHPDVRDMASEALKKLSDNTSNQSSSPVDQGLLGTIEGMVNNPWITQIINRNFSVEMRFRLKKMAGEFLTRDHDLKKELFDEVDAWSDEEILDETEEYLNTIPSKDNKWFGRADQLFEIKRKEAIKIRELFLHPTVGRDDLSQILVLYYGYSTKMIDLILQDDEHSEPRVRSNIKGGYMFFRAIEILSRKTDLVLIQEQDIDETEGNLFYYLQSEGGIRSMVKILLDLGDFLIDQQVEVASKLESIGNFKELINKLQRVNGWAEELAIESNDLKIAELQAAFSELSQSAPVEASSPINETDKEVGGIDLNAIEVDRQGAGVDIQFDPVEVQQIIDMGIDGFAPVIINIVPLPSILPLLGLAPQREEEFEVSSL